MLCVTWCGSCTFCNTSTQEIEVGGPEFRANLVYTVSSRPTWATQQDYLKKQNKKVKDKQQKSVHSWGQGR